MLWSMMENSNQHVRIVYTNYRGETAIREIIPQRVWFGATEWHPEEQWLLDALDLEKNAVRAFAMRDIRVWF
jgi:predicted DNA-binding transcriptional regulator YafY